jgi:hypothetical protein
MIKLNQQAWVTSLLLLAAPGAQAHCGLNFCPRDAETRGHVFEAGLALQRTGFDLNGHGGQYTEIIPRFQYTRNGRLLLGADLPFAGLDVEGDVHWGLENPLLFGEWRMFPGMGNRFSLGLQAELPFGDHDNGLASHHMMLVPYAAFGKGLDPFSISATLGFSAAVELGGSAEDTIEVPLFPYVHPHEDREILYRLGAGMSLWKKRANPEIFLSGQHVLVDEKESVRGDDDLTAGILVPIKAGRFTVMPKAEFPILAPARFDWTAGLDCRWEF